FHLLYVRCLTTRRSSDLPFLKSLPLYHEWGNYLFVHAGVNMQKENWRDSSSRDFVWIREGFYDQPNHTDKTIIFGYTVTATLNKDRKSTRLNSSHVSISY